MILSINEIYEDIIYYTNNIMMILLIIITYLTSKADKHYNGYKQSVL